MSERHDAAVLLAVLREDWEEFDRLLERQIPDAATFARLAQSCDVQPWVHALLEREQRLTRFGSGLAPIFDRARSKVRTDNLLLLARTEQALDLLLAAGIRPVALKGLEVLHRFYTAFDQRRLDDVDLLVHPDQAQRACEVLADAGWTLPAEPERTHWLRSSFEIPVSSPGAVPVTLEIHWSIGQVGRYRIDVDRMLADAVPLEVSGKSILRLDDHDAVAHLLLHHLQHYFDRRLKWSLELGWRVNQPGFCWDVVARRLSAWEGRAAAGLALQHQARLFPRSVDAAATKALPVAAWRRLLTLPLRSSHPLEMYHGTRRRGVQLFLAGVALERPWNLPAYLRHRATRDGLESEEPGI